MLKKKLSSFKIFQSYLNFCIKFQHHGKLLEKKINIRKDKVVKWQ